MGSEYDQRIHEELWVVLELNLGMALLLNQLEGTYWRLSTASSLSLLLQVTLKCLSHLIILGLKYKND